MRAAAAAADPLPLPSGTVHAREQRRGCVIQADEGHFLPFAAARTPMDGRQAKGMTPPPPLNLGVGQKGVACFAWA